MAGGRAARHGITIPRGLAAPPRTPGGRFGTMFDGLKACAVVDDDIDELFKMLDRRKTEFREGAFPAGFTYLGQFVDHDITFDQTPIEQRAVDPDALVSFRTPRLDLDSLYGGGPQRSPRLYDPQSTPPAAKLLVGVNPPGPFEPEDLPRDDTGLALVGDPRNDENLIIAQLHLMFIRFHNAVVDILVARGVVPEKDLFEEARRLVRWHYQWIVAHEFLHHVVGHSTADAVFARGAAGAPPTVHLTHFTFEGEPFIPLEFSGAAFRFGHSLVRPDYAINDTLGRAIPIFPRDGGEEGDHLGGLRRLPKGLKIDWRRFFLLQRGLGPRFPRAGHLIDTSIAPALFDLPGDRALPLLNLRRGQKLELPSGQDVATRMEIPQLKPAELDFDQRLPAASRTALLAATPLWYYVLAEAQSRRGGACLGPVGGRIVAEVLVGLLAGDPDSYLSRDPTWLPDKLIPKRRDFEMADLIRLAGG